MQTDIRSVRASEESARAFVYRVLSAYIREMFLHPGEKLAETDVAAELQVSRTPVHDTFSRLEREKMLRSVPRGAVDAPHGLPGRFGRIVQSPPRYTGTAGALRCGGARGAAGRGHRENGAPAA